ncbi:LysR family transcriptional regulator [Achromobacter insolitus]|uniref:LysR family transcriptional regulator n=1 Tax=Achromobacter insolitus TaxID=217204 RepID=UPI0011EB8737|nr:LysR family transcriptional regulator [Achromobacter insolitus]QEK90847.1 LysR family transcriptional regulator [Achromobacter insolitus]
MNCSLRQLRGFLAVAEHASFTKAAAQLHLTQAGLSAMVREFEQNIGSRLFERSTRAVLLTEAGRTLLPVAQRMVDELGGALRQLAAASTPQARVLRVGVTPLIASSILPQVLRACSVAQPDWRVEVADMDRSLIQQGVEDGSLDAGFGAFFQKAAGLRRRSLFPAELVLAQSAEHAAKSRRAPLSWQRLDPGSLIVLPASNPIQQLIDRHVPRLPDSAASPPRRVYSHLETILALVEAGLGQAVVPSFAALTGARWRVHLRALAPRVALDYAIVTRSGRRDSAGLTAFVDSLRIAAQADGS